MVQIAQGVVRVREAMPAPNNPLRPPLGAQPPGTYAQWGFEVQWLRRVLGYRLNIHYHLWPTEIQDVVKERIALQQTIHWAQCVVTPEGKINQYVLNHMDRFPQVYNNLLEGVAFRHYYERLEP